MLRSVFFYSAQLSGEPKNSAPKKKNSAPKSKKCPCGIPKMTFPKHSNVENEFWFSTSFTLPIGIGEHYVESKNAFWFLVFDVPIGPTLHPIPSTPMKNDLNGV